MSFWDKLLGRKNNAEEYDEKMGWFRKSRRAVCAAA